MRIRRLVEQVDEQHREAMRTIEDHPGEQSGDTSRRRFVRNLGLGGAVAVGAAAVPATILASTTAAAAQSSSSSEEADLTPDESAIVAFAIGLELALEAAYEQAVDTRIFDSEQDELARTFARHHHEHAVALNTLAGGDSDEIGSANQALLDTLAPQLAGADTPDALMQVLYDAEQSAAASYFQALSEIETGIVSASAASIMPIEAQHATTIGAALELPQDQWMPPFQTNAGAYDRNRFAG